MNEKSVWLNTEKIINKKTIKPCKLCGFCPYGKIVEEFELREKRNEFSCKIYGHDCPAFYHAEPFTEEQLNEKEMKKAFKMMDKEFINFFKPKQEEEKTNGGMKDESRKNKN